MLNNVVCNNMTIEFICIILFIYYKMFNRDTGQVLVELQIDLLTLFKTCGEK